MDESKYSELSSFFSLKKWNNMSAYDKERNYNLLENYKVLQSFGKFLNQDVFSIFTSELFRDKYEVFISLGLVESLYFIINFLYLKLLLILLNSDWRNIDLLWEICAVKLNLSHYDII